MTEIDLETLKSLVVGEKPINERIHDLKESLLVIDGFLRDMNRGYKFDDSFAAAKSKILADVFTNLKDEVKTLQRIYEQISDT